MEKWGCGFCQRNQNFNLPYDSTLHKSFHYLKRSELVINSWTIRNIKRLNDKEKVWLPDKRIAISVAIGGSILIDVALAVEYIGQCNRKCFK